MQLHSPAGVLVLALLTAMRANAQQEASGQVPRTLGEHAFLVPARFETAFVMTHFGFRQGVALTQLHDVPVPGTESTQDVTLLGLSERFHLGVALLDWLGAYASLQGHVVAGADLESALLRGALLDLSWEIGPSFRVWRNESTATEVGARLRLRQKYGRSIAPEHATLLIEQGMNEMSISREELRDTVLGKQTATTAGVVLAAAQALDRQLGIQVAIEGQLGGVHSEIDGREGRVETDARRAVLATAVGLSARFDPDAPLGVSIEHRYQATFDDAQTRDVTNLGDSHHTFGAGLFYVGHPDVTLGIFTSVLFGQVTGQARDTEFFEFLIECVF